MVDVAAGTTSAEQRPPPDRALRGDTDRAADAACGSGGCGLNQADLNHAPKVCLNGALASRYPSAADPPVGRVPGVTPPGVRSLTYRGAVPDTTGSTGARHRVLVTGHAGLVGRALVPVLQQHGFEVVGLDLAEGADLLDPPTVRARLAGCRSVVHLAAVDDEPESPGPLDPPSTGDQEQVLRTNVGGTALLLAEAARAGVERVVLMSSVDVLGCFLGQGPPAYLPLDDAHPTDPRGPYAWSKLVAEELCATFTRATGAPSVCLRAPGVVDASTYAFLTRAREARPASEWSPVWEYGAFVDVEDLARAVLAALTTADLRGHHRLLVNADDISSRTEDGPTLAARLLPDVPLRQPDRFREDRFAALVDSGGARAVLGWAPRRRWRGQPGGVEGDGIHDGDR